MIYTSNVGWLVMFNIPSTGRSFRDSAPIFCPLRRTWNLVFTLSPPGIEPWVVWWQSFTQPLRHAGSTTSNLSYAYFFLQNDILTAASLKYLVDSCSANMTHFNVSGNTLKGFNSVLNDIMVRRTLWCACNLLYPMHTAWFFVRYN